MKPFNLEEAKQGKPVVTRDGRDVRILVFDKQGEYCIVTLVSNLRRYEDVLVYREDGSASAVHDSEYDLFMKAEKKEGWVNIYPQDMISRSYETEELAKSNAARNHCIATIKVEWEE